MALLKRALGVIFVALLITQATARLQHGSLYTISFQGTQSDACTGRYLSYKRNGGAKDTRVTLNLPSAAATPATWRARKLKDNSYVLEAAMRPKTAPVTLSYSTACTSTAVSVTRGSLQRWSITPVNMAKGLYIVKAARKSICKTPIMGRLAPLAKTTKRGKCGSINGVALAPVTVATRSMVWKFSRVLPTPAPSPPVVIPPVVIPPPPTVVVEVPKVSFAVGFVGITVEQFGTSERTKFCDNLIAASNYPGDKVNCTITDVRPVTTAPQGRRLSQQGDGVVVEGELSYTVESPQDAANAQNSSQNVVSGLQNTNTLNEIFEDVSDDITGITLESVEETKEEQVVEDPQERTDVSASPTPGGETSPPPQETPSPSPVAPEPSPAAEASPEPSPSPPAVPSPIPPLSPLPPSTVPLAPLNPTATFPSATCGNAVSVSWGTPPSDEIILSYAVQCTSTDAGVTAVSANVAGTLNTATLGPLIVGKTYACTVTATSPVGTSSPSAAASFTTTSCPGKPTAVTTQDVYMSSTTWKATWTDAATAASPTEKYSVKCVASNDDLGCEATAVGEATGIDRGVGEGSLTGLTGGTTYDCYVVATNSAGTACSDAVEFTTPAFVAPAAPTAVSTEAVSGQLNQRKVTWTMPDSTSLAPSSYTITCTSTHLLTYLNSAGTTTTETVTRTATATHPATSATVGTTLDMPAGKYTCSVSATNAAGEGTATESSAFIAGSTCGDLGATDTILPAVVKATEDTPQAISYVPTYAWYQDDTRPGGEVSMVDLEATPLVDKTGGSVAAAPSGSSKAVKLTTTTTSSKAGIAYNSPDILLGKKISELLTDPNFALGYNWWKDACPSPACAQTGSPGLKVWLHQPETTQTGKFCNMVYEPYYNQKDNNDVPISWDAQGVLQKWNTEKVTVADGNTNLLSSGLGGARGWWVTNTCWGDAAYKSGNKYRSLSVWWNYFMNLDATLGDAVIVKVQMEVGSGLNAMTTYVDDIYLKATGIAHEGCEFGV